MNIIEVDNLCKNYGEIKAVNNISFNVKKGSLFAFLGENGAGKSTTINILCSILQKDSGKITICGYDLDKDEEMIKRQVGIVFQNSLLDNLLTVNENLWTRASFYGLTKQQFNARIEELDKVLPIKDILNRKYGKLSGGQRRKVDIIRALLNKPQVLFLDEPTTGLDPKSRINVWQAINDLRKENNLTVFLTTHYMEETQDADNVVILDKGNIVENNTPAKLKKKYAHDQIKLYQDKNKKIEQILNDNNLKFEYLLDHYVIDMKDSDAVKKFILDNQEYIKDFEVVKGNMDQVFLKVTGRKLGEGA